MCGSQKMVNTGIVYIKSNYYYSSPLDKGITVHTVVSTLKRQRLRGENRPRNTDVWIPEIAPRKSPSEWIEAILEQPPSHIRPNWTNHRVTVDCRKKYRAWLYPEDIFRKSGCGTKPSLYTEYGVQRTEILDIRDSNRTVSRGDDSFHESWVVKPSFIRPELPIFLAETHTLSCRTGTANEIEQVVIEHSP